ncbi:MAG: hypothetical protein ABID63_11180 [Pseudomonadota bacterium]
MRLVGSRVTRFHPGVISHCRDGIVGAAGSLRAIGMRVLFPPGPSPVLSPARSLDMGVHGTGRDWFWRSGFRSGFRGGLLSPDTTEPDMPALARPPAHPACHESGGL